MDPQIQLKFFGTKVLKQKVFLDPLDCIVLKFFLDLLVKTHFYHQKILHNLLKVSNIFSISFQIYHSNQKFLYQSFGKEIFGWNDKSGTRWKICWIPLGGYVKFFGDRNVFSQADQEKILKQYNQVDQEKLFVLKPLYQRTLIVFGGPLANGPPNTIKVLWYKGFKTKSFS